MFRRLGERGCTDQDLAVACNTSAVTVAQWRRTVGVRWSGPLGVPNVSVQRNRTQLDPADARLPRATRRLTEHECGRLRRLDVSVPRGGYNTVDPTDRAHRHAGMAARDDYLLALWVDRVAAAHLADVLGISDAAVTLALRRAQQRRAEPAVRRPYVPAPTPPRWRDLTEQETRLLVTAWQGATDPARPGPVRESGRRALLMMTDRLRDDRVRLTTIAAALGTNRNRLWHLLSRIRHRPTAP